MKGVYLPPVNTFFLTIESQWSCRHDMSHMSVVFYKFRMIIALLSGFFGIYFNFLGYRFSKFGLFSMGFLSTYFVSVSVSDVIVTASTSDPRGRLTQSSSTGCSVPWSSRWG